MFRQTAGSRDLVLYSVAGNQAKPDRQMDLWNCFKCEIKDHVLVLEGLKKIYLSNLKKRQTMNTADRWMYMQMGIYVVWQVFCETDFLCWTVLDRVTVCKLCNILLLFFYET